MDKQKFLDKLAFELRGIPWQEIQKQKAYYAEMLDDMLEDGMTEEQAVEKLGDPAVIAREILQEPGIKRVVIEPGRKQTYTQPPRKKPSGEGSKKQWNTVAVVLLILGAPLWISLLLAAAGVVISIYLALISILLSVYAVTFAILTGAVAMVIVAGFNFAGCPAGAVAALGIGLILLAAGLLGILLSWLATVGLIRGTKWVWVKSRDCIRRRREK